jgi:hypothetical protein
MLSRLEPLRGATATLIALTLAGCAAQSPFSGRVALDSTPLVVDVENRNWWDMEVELDAEGTQFRLGVAPSYGRVQFRVSASRLGEAGYFRLVANPMDTGREAFSSVRGQGVFTTPVIEMLDHRQVRWTVGSSDATTSLIVR